MRSRQTNPADVSGHDNTLANLTAAIHAALRLVDEGLAHTSAGPHCDRLLDIKLALTPKRPS
jgi:hypothetical protein